MSLRTEFSFRAAQLKSQLCSLRMHFYMTFPETLMKGDIGQVRKALDRNPDRVHFYGDDGTPTVHLAATYGRLDVLQELRKRGADVTRRTIEPGENLVLLSARDKAQKQLQFFEAVTDLSSPGGAKTVENYSACIDYLARWEEDARRKPVLGITMG